MNNNVYWIVDIYSLTLTGKWMTRDEVLEYFNNDLNLVYRCIFA